MSGFCSAEIPFQEITKLGFLPEMRVGENTGIRNTVYTLLYYPVVGVRYQSG